MKIEHLPPYSSDKEHIQLLEGLLARHNERIHKLEDVLLQLHCCAQCQYKASKGATRELVFFGKEYWSAKKDFAQYERGILKLAKDGEGTWWSTTSYVDRVGYACSKTLAGEAIVETMGYAKSKWFRHEAI